MTQPQFLNTARGHRIAYHLTPGRGVGVVFLGGFKSDMTGTKALHLQDWAQAQGRPFLRFDYSGHGQSSGDFADGAIGDWFEDAVSVITGLTEGPQILVGSSMGGWLALLVARSLPHRVCGLVGIAAAPDFTEDSLWNGFSPAERERLLTEGRVERASDYGPEPYVFTRRLIEEGRAHLVLREPLRLACPVRLLHGTADRDVALSVALRLLDHATGPDITLTLVKDADHRFSTAACLATMTAAVTEILENGAF